MFISFPGIFTILLLIFIIPLLFLLGFFHLVARGLENIGLSGEIALLTLAMMVIGSFLNIPLTRRKITEVEDTSLIVGPRKRHMVSGLAINVGGAIIPIALVVYLIPHVPPAETLLAIALMVVVTAMLARAVPHKGISLPMFLPPFAAALFAIILAPENPAPVAFVSGVFGVLVGADIVRIPMLKKQEPGMLVIGGAGVFDGIFLVGVISALLAGLY